MKILIIGGGNMGKTYAESFTSNHVVSKDNLYILEHLSGKMEYFQTKGFTNLYIEPGYYITASDLVIFAIKPQDRDTLYASIASYFHKDQLVLSIMAGVTVESIKQALPTTKIIRAMPNLPAQIGMGITGFISDPTVSKEELFKVQNLLNTTGKSLYFEDESQLDAVTAVSGSGPAYVYYFMDAMIKAAIEMGFDQTQAELLVEQTFIGAVHLLNMNTLTCQQWIEKVASKGGTTEAALKKFNEDKLALSIKAGLESAFNRAVQLGS
ncbi:MAG: pyrroline-5-carboxylate reductase [Bacteroidota bacterium]|nr:pyrroline-5-carboxylate reductase [Bacteroidota bacterium]